MGPKRFVGCCSAMFDGRWLGCVCQLSVRVCMCGVRVAVGSPCSRTVSLVLSEGSKAADELASQTAFI